MKLKRLVATLLTVVVLMGLLPMTMVPASAKSTDGTMATSMSQLLPTRYTDVQGLLNGLHISKFEKKDDKPVLPKFDGEASATWYYNYGGSLFTGIDDSDDGTYNSVMLYMPGKEVDEKDWYDKDVILVSWMHDDVMRVATKGMTWKGKDNNEVEWHKDGGFNQYAYWTPITTSNDRLTASGAGATFMIQVEWVASMLQLTYDRFYASSPLPSDYTSKKQSRVEMYASDTQLVNNGRWFIFGGNGGNDDYESNHSAKGGDWITFGSDGVQAMLNESDVLRSAVELVFGTKIYGYLNTSAPLTDVAGLTLTDQKQLVCCLQTLGTAPGYTQALSNNSSLQWEDWVTNTFRFALMSEAERKAIDAASAVELLGDKTLSNSSDEYFLIRDSANRYNASNQTNPDSYNSLLNSPASPLGFATSKNIGCPTGGPYSDYSGVKPFAIEAYKSLAYYIESYVNTPIPYKEVDIVGEVGAKGMAIMAADSQYLQLSRDNPLFESATDIRTHAERWALHMRIAYGLALGERLGSGSTVETWKFYGLDTCLLAVPPKCIGTDVLVNFGGFEALILSINELPNMATTIVTALANYVQTDSKDFTSVKEEIAAMRSIYDTLSWFDDANLWEFWTSNVFDHRQGVADDKRVSLKDVYDYLVANNAFSVLDDGDGSDNALDEDFGYFFSSVGELSNSIKTGIKVSASFLPMHTNVYNPETWDTYVDTGWLLNYYAKFGYFRKALYIDTAADAASAWVNTRGRGQLTVATLDDLLQDKDIVLYLDDNLYNVDDLAELVNMSWDRLGQGENQSSLGTFESWGAAISDLWSLSMPELAKTGERTAYSQRVDMSKDKWKGFFFSNKASAPEPSPSPDPADPSAAPADPNQTPADATKKTSGDEDDITMYLWPDEVWDTDTNQLHGTVKDDEGNVTDTATTTEYTPLFAFAVLSAIYRDESKALMRGLNQTLSSNNPVFISSATAPYMGRAYSHLIFNYMLTRNLESQIEVDYAASLDMTSPLYMDIFGNILTESGLVVIPAAANATLWDYEKYKPYNAAFCTCYGDNFLLSAYQDEVDNEGKVHLNTDVGQLLAGGSVRLCTLKDGVWYLNSIEVMSGEVDLAKISTASKDSLQDVVDTWGYIIQTGGPGLYDINLWRMLITEVLRGAPIESIDKQFEGIQTDVSYTRNGLIIADKLETLCNAIAPAGQNASLAIPNPAFIDGIEIIVFFVYKLLILAVLIIWMVNIYLDATGGVIGIKTGLKCIGVVVLVLALIVGVPKVFELSYYESNKHLLQDETEYLLMLNTEKKANGQEIGVSKVRPPETSTVLYLHLADIDMPWWDILPNIGLSAGYKSLDEMYKDYANRHPLAYTEYATTMNDGVYISVEQLFSSAVVQFSPLSHRMYLRGDDNTPASYYTPYYYFLNMLVQDISDWSKGAGGAVAYTTKVQKGGELKTLGYCKLYFESEDFLEEGGDYFHLYDLYGVTAPRTFPGRYSLPDDQMEMVRQSQWCSFQNGQMSEKGYIDRINKLQTYAQEWIANNHGMIGRISDETFLKCFALSCAMEHNRLFNTQRADYLEIQQLSNEDLLRLSIADHNKVMSNSSMSYARFVYTTGGTIACYLAAILELVNLVSSWVKPACTLLVFCIACISIFVLKLILRRGNNSIMGYILTITLMCSVNVLGAAVTKLSMFLPNTGLTPSLCILLQVLVQIGYIFLQLKIVSFALRDWRNVGYQQYEHQYNKLHLPGRRSENISRNVLTPHGFTGYDELDRLNNRKLGRRIRK